MALTRVLAEKTWPDKHTPDSIIRQCKMLVENLIIKEDILNLEETSAVKAFWFHSEKYLDSLEISSSKIEA